MHSGTLCLHHPSLGALVMTDLKHTLPCRLKNSPRQGAGAKLAAHNTPVRLFCETLDSSEAR